MMASVLAVCISINTEHFQDVKLLVIIEEGCDGMLTPHVPALPTLLTYKAYLGAGAYTLISNG